MKDDKHLKDISKKLCEKMSKINDAEGMFFVLRDLLTYEEVQEIIQRFDIASMLEKGLSYKEIEAKTGASSTTVARVSKYLKGPNGGYTLLLK